MDNKNTSDSNAMAEILGDSIFSYTREKTIRDGVLVDVSETAVEAGIIFSNAVTRTVWDVLYMARCFMVRAGKHTGSISQTTVSISMHWSRQ